MKKKNDVTSTEDVGPDTPEPGEPVVIDEGNVNTMTTDLPPGPVDDPDNEQPYNPIDVDDALRHPVEKGNQEGKIGVVDRVLTEKGAEVGIEHGVVSHELNEQGIEPEGEPIMRCPNCGNVNIALHNKARTSAHCPSCLWQSGHLRAKPNPPDRVPGMHEVDGVHADAGEIPKGKLEGALGMDPVEAKEGVPVEDAPQKEVTVWHTGDDGEPILAKNESFVRPWSDPETKDGHMPGNVA